MDDQIDGLIDGQIEGQRVSLVKGLSRGVGGETWGRMIWAEASLPGVIGCKRVRVMVELMVMVKLMVKERVNLIKGFKSRGEGRDLSVRALMDNTRVRMYLFV